MNKIEELKSVIGKDVSQNFSPTCRARLVKVNKVNSTFESVPSPYNKFPKQNLLKVFDKHFGHFVTLYR